MEYPLFNINSISKDLEIIDSFFLYNDYYISKDNCFFQEFFLDLEFVSSSGEVYKVIGKEKIIFPWYKFYKLTRYKMLFEKTEKELTFEEVKNRLIRIIDSLDENINNLWMAKLNKSITIKELLDESHW